MGLYHDELILERLPGRLHKLSMYQRWTDVKGVQRVRVEVDGSALAAAMSAEAVPGPDYDANKTTMQLMMVFGPVDFLNEGDLVFKTFFPTKPCPTTLTLSVSKGRPKMNQLKKWSSALSLMFISAEPAVRFSIWSNATSGNSSKLIRPHAGPPLAPNPEVDVELIPRWNYSWANRSRPVAPGSTTSCSRKGRHCPGALGTGAHPVLFPDGPAWMASADILGSFTLLHSFPAAKCRPTLRCAPYGMIPCLAARLPVVARHPRRCTSRVLRGRFS